MRSIYTSKLNTHTTTTITHHSPWHSPIPYLFGGIAAILGLIAFALLVLACSYTGLSSGNNQGGSHNRDLENKEEGDDSQNKESIKVYEEKILVIMAGDDKPTFLATPVGPKYEKETIDNHVIVPNAATTPQENQGSQHGQ